MGSPLPDRATHLGYKKRYIDAVLDQSFVLLHYFETWALTAAVEVSLCNAECWMIRMICGVKVSSAELCQRVGMDMAVQDVILRNCL